MISSTSSSSTSSTSSSSTSSTKASSFRVIFPSEIRELEMTSLKIVKNDTNDGDDEFEVNLFVTHPDHLLKKECPVNVIFKGVEYNFKVPFNRRGNVQVTATINNDHLYGSPYTVHVSPSISQPVIRWYKQDKNYFPYSKKVSELIEKHYQNPATRANEQVTIAIPGPSTIGGGAGDSSHQSLVLDFKGMQDITNKNILSFFVRCPRIIRGTWFVEGDGSVLIPYSADNAEKLERWLVDGLITSQIDVSEDNKNRVVMKFFDGSFRQFRISEHGHPDGRQVYRGYKGKCTIQNNS